MLDRQDREPAEAGLAGDRLERGRAQRRCRSRRSADRPGRWRGRRRRCSRRTAARPRHRRGERLGDALVADEDRAARGEQPPSGRPGPRPAGPCRGRPRRSSRGRSGRRRRQSAASANRNDTRPSTPSAPACAFARAIEPSSMSMPSTSMPGKWRAIEIDDQPVPQATSATRPCPVAQPRGDVRQRVDPVADEVLELRSVDALLGLDHVGSVVGPVDAVAGAVRIEQLRACVLPVPTTNRDERRRRATGSPDRRGPRRDRRAASTGARPDRRRRRRRRGSPPTACCSSHSRA